MTVWLDNLPVPTLTPAEALRRIQSMLVRIDPMYPGDTIDEHTALPECFILQLAQYEELVELILKLEAKRMSSDQKDDGGQVFPNFAYGHVEESQGSADQNIHLKFRGGMTLRDYFAAESIAALADTPRGADEMELVADRAYRLADAMLKARAE